MKRAIARAARAMAMATRWRATKRAIASIIYNINMCITMIIVVNAHDGKKLTFRGGVLRYMPLLPLDEYGQTKHIGHRPCM
jgi:hypothetical protein